VVADRAVPGGRKHLLALRTAKHHGDAPGAAAARANPPESGHLRPVVLLPDARIRDCLRRADATDQLPAGGVSVAHPGAAALAHTRAVAHDVSIPHRGGFRDADGGPNARRCEW